MILLVLLILAISLFVFTYVVAMVRAHERLRISANRECRPAVPSDRRIPAPVRLFWREVNEPLKAQGFTPAAYMTRENLVFNYTAYFYVAIFENREARDWAFVSAVLTDVPPARIRPFLSVSFESEMEDGTKIYTDNVGHLPVMFPSPWSKTWRIPSLGDLSRLYDIHQALSARQSAAKKAIPPHLDYAAWQNDGELRQLMACVEAGYLFLDREERWFRHTWKGAVLLAWAQQWPVKKVRCWLMARRARRLLRELGMPEDYPTVDYVKLIKQRQAEEPASAAEASPDELYVEPAEGVVCATCSRPIVASYYEVYGNVTCPDCQEMLWRQADGGSPIKRLLRAVSAGMVIAILGAICLAACTTKNYQTWLGFMLIGLLVGCAVRWGARRRGGWFYRALAVTITYVAMATTYAAPYALDVIQRPRRPYSTTAGVIVERTVILARVAGYALTIPLRTDDGGPFVALIMVLPLLAAWKLNKAHAPLRISGPYAVTTEVPAPPPVPPTDAGDP